MFTSSSGALEQQCLSFLGLGKSDEDDREEEEEEAPTCLKTKYCSQFLVISTDKLSVRYTGDGKHGNDVGSIQANRPAPTRRIIYYFEMTVLNSGKRGAVSIGFTDHNFRTSRQPGWEPNTYGYHGDDGKLYHGPKISESFGPPFATGDTVGAGINYAAQELFFTKNNKLVGTTYKDYKHALYPTVGLHSPEERVSLNFGQAPFVFDIEALIQEERERRQRAIENIPLTLSTSHSVVRSYLLHYGYQDTLSAFDEACGSTFPSVLASSRNGAEPAYEDYALEQRKVLRRLAREGDVDAVFARLREWYPKLFQEGKSAIAFLLHCQKFIELVKAGSVETAIRYASAELAKYFGTEPFEILLQDCFALLAYERPAASPVGHLFQLGQREFVADAVNAVVMATNPALASSGNPPQSSLEKLLRQLTTCQKELNGDQGDVFRLHKVLQGGSNW